MREHPLVRSILKFVKFALLVGLVVLGIVFMPDDFVAHIKDCLAGVGQFFQNEVMGRWPAISHDLDQKLDSTLVELGKWWQVVKEKFSATIGDWVMEKINGKYR